MRYDDVVSKSSIRFIHITASEFEQQAANHSSGRWALAQGGHCYHVIRSPQELKTFFGTLLSDGVKLDGMDFHAHGVSHVALGQLGISFDTGTFNYENISHFQDSRFDTVFNPSANITFYGCEVGRSASGEYFLTRVGNTFLSSGGGTVRAYRVLGGANPITAYVGAEETPSSFDGEPERNDNTLVTAHIRSNGGCRRIQNASYLTPNKIIRRLTQLQQKAWVLLSSRSITMAVRDALSEILVRLDRKMNRLSSQPDYTYMFHVTEWLEQEESRFARMIEDIPFRPSTGRSSSIVSNRCGYD